MIISKCSHCLVGVRIGTRLPWLNTCSVCCFGLLWGRIGTQYPIRYTCPQAFFGLWWPRRILYGIVCFWCLNPSNRYSIFGPPIPGDSCAFLRGHGATVRSWSDTTSLFNCVGNQNALSFQLLIFVYLTVEIHDRFGPIGGPSS